MIDSDNEEMSIEELAQVSGGRIAVVDAKTGKEAPRYDSGKSAKEYGGKGNLLTTIKPNASSKPVKP